MRRRAGESWSWHVLTLAILLVVPCALGAVELTRLSPLGMRPGDTVDVTVHGEGLDDSPRLWTSFECDTELAPGVESNGEDPSRVTFRIRVPADRPVQVGGLRVATRKGVSNLALFVIDDLDARTVEDPASDRSGARAIDVPSAVDATVVAQRSSFWRIDTSAGQRLSVEVFARRLGSSLDPLVRLLSLDGRTLAGSDDTPGLQGDVSISHVAQRAGPLILEIRDAQHRGGDDFFYRLRVGSFPCAPVPYPLVIERGKSTPVRIVSATGSETRSTLTPALDDPSRHLHFAAGDDALGATKSGGTALACVDVSDGPEALEEEPNDVPGEATHVANLPCGLNGRFDHRGDRDLWSFQVKKGQGIRVVGRTWSLGSPATLFLRILDPRGQTIAESVPSGTDRREVEFTAGTDGRHFLVVEDLHRRHGPRLVYHVEVEPQSPGFSLSVAAERYDAPELGVFVAKLTCVRQAFDGPISLRVEGPGGAYLVDNGTIPQGKSSAEIHVALPTSLPSGSAAAIRIVGEGRLPPTKGSTPEAQLLRATASAAIAMRAPLRGLTRPPRQLVEQIGVGVGPVFPDFFRARCTPPLARADRSAAEARLRVRVERLEGFSGGLTVAARGLPEGVTCAPKTIEKGRRHTYLVLAGTDSLPEGHWTFRVEARGNYKNQPRTVALDDVVLRVGPPLDVRVALSGPLRPGGQVTATIDVERFTSADDPVHVVWKKLPDGVTASGPTEIASGTRRIEMELHAAVSAKATDLHDLLLAATTRLPPPPTDALDSGESLTEIHSPESLAKLARIFEAEKFQRGNVTIDTSSYGKGIGIISDPGGQDNFVEYDVEMDTDGPYQVELRYAAESARPGRLLINGEIVKDDAMGKVTGTWFPDSQRWFVEGVFRFVRGKNVVRLEVSPTMSHIDKILIGPAIYRQVLRATFDSWIIAGSSTTAKELDGNLVSIFASDGLTGKARMGIVSFDASEIGGHPIRTAWLELGVDGRESRLAKGPASSIARLLPPGTDGGALRYASYRALLDRSVLFETFGSFDVKDGKSRAAGQFEPGGRTSSEDLAALGERLRTSPGNLVFSLEAREDGSATSRDWGADDAPPKGTHPGPLPPRLVVLLDPGRDGGDESTNTVEVLSKPLVPKPRADGGSDE